MPSASDYSQLKAMARIGEGRGPYYPGGSLTRKNPGGQRRNLAAGTSPSHQAAYASSASRRAVKEQNSGKKATPQSHKANFGGRLHQNIKRNGGPINYQDQATIMKEIFGPRKRLGFSKYSNFTSGPRSNFKSKGAVPLSQPYEPTAHQHEALESSRSKKDKFLSMEGSVF